MSEWLNSDHDPEDSILWNACGVAPDLNGLEPDDYRNVSAQVERRSALTVQNAAGLNIGLRHDDALTGAGSWTDLGGNPVDPDDLDVELDLYR